MVEGGLDGGSEGTVVPCPKLRNTGGAGFASHVENEIGFFEVERIANGVPGLRAESSGVFGVGRVLQDGDARNVLAKETEAEGDATRHAKAPAEVARSVFAEVVVKAGFQTARGQQNARRHGHAPERWRNWPGRGWGRG